MKKIIFYLMLWMGIPILTVFCAGLFFDGVTIGDAAKTMQDCRMGKNIIVEIKGLCKTMDVEEYLVGVLAGVISTEHDSQALMAQAVVVRTNILREMEELQTEEAKELSYHYLSVEERRALFGEKEYKKKEKKLERAVQQTAGQVLVWDDALIMAVYHEVSIGKTLSAKEGIGEEIPYLQAVESPQDVEAGNYMEQKEYTWEELERVLGQANAKKLGVQITEVSEHGLVRKVLVGEKEYTGEEFAERIGLHSVIFEKEDIDQGVRFVGLGQGNGMGLSMYGANYMAQQGKSYEEILDYYYSGAVLKVC